MLSGIPNKIFDEDLENTVINICKMSGIDVDTRDIEVCHQLPLSRNSRGHDKRVIVKFVNWKVAEAMLKDKKQISPKNFGHLNVTNKVFVSVSLCPHYRFIWGTCKDLQRQRKVYHVFCLGGIVCIKLSENGGIVNLRIRILKIDFCKYSICSVYIVKSLSFFLCEAIFLIFPWKLVTSLPPTPLLFIDLLLLTGFTEPVFTSLYIFYWLLLFHSDTKMASNKKMCDILKINDILTTLSIIVAVIITRHYYFNKDISQKEKLTAPYPLVINFMCPRGMFWILAYLSHQPKIIRLTSIINLLIIFFVSFLLKTN